MLRINMIFNEKFYVSDKTKMHLLLTQKKYDENLP